MQSTSRERTDLSGEWTLIPDPDDAGVAAGWNEPGAAWPTEHTRTVDVPHAWQESDGLRDYTGVAWYRRTVTVPDPDDERRRFLRFGAVDHEATVWVDGERVGTNSDGYLPFEVEVTDALAAGENAVVVRVEDPENLDGIPHGKQGEPWYTRVSGIWGDVTLAARPATFVDDVRVTPDLETDAAAVEVSVSGETSGLTAGVTVSHDGEAVASETTSVSGGRGRCEVQIPDPVYWTPEDPALYDVTVRLREGDGQAGGDEYTDYFGMRSVSIDADRLYLNGEPCYVRGALDQAYYPKTLYRPFADDLFEREVELAKEMGFNMLRKHVKPAHPDFVEAADRLGILVWEEPANPTVYSDRSRDAVREQMRRLVERDYNRPSVVIWSIYNEEWGIGLDQRDWSDHPGRLWNDAEKQQYLTDLYREVREWDPTRPVCDNSGWAHVATDLNDYHEYFVSPDRAGPWAERLDDIHANPADNYAVESTPAEEAPVLISEFGTWGFSDPTDLREHYGGDPPWFEHEFLDHPLKRPAGVDDRFESTDLSAVFDDYADLASVWQRRQYDSISNVIEEMRTRDDLAGYVITEFSDIEWEFNGMLDYLREPKAFTADLPACNGERVVVLDPERHVVAAGQSVTVTVSVVDDTGDPLEGTLSWDGPGGRGELAVSATGSGTTEVTAVTLSIPADADTGPKSVEATVETGDERLANSEPLVVVQPEDPPSRTVYAEEPLAGRLREAGVEVTESLAAADVAVATGHVGPDVESFAAAGNVALVVPGPDGRMTSVAGGNEASGDGDDRVDGGVFDYRQLPAGESWNLVASLLYQDSDLVRELCPGRRVGWAFEGIFPHDMAVDLSDETVHVGSVEGWLANWSSPLAVREVGDGRVCSCTFRVTDAYGDHPTATLLVNRLLGER